MEGPRRLKSEKVVILEHLFNSKEFEVHIWVSGIKFLSILLVYWAGMVEMGGQ